MQELIDTITNLVREIPRGKYFDTHLIINLLIKRYSDIYNQYASPTLPKHGNIGQIIDSLKQLVDNVGLSYSENIHGNVTECTLWRKKI